MSWVQLADTMVPLLKTSEQTNVPAMSRVALKVMEAWDTAVTAWCWGVHDVSFTHVPRDTCCPDKVVRLQVREIYGDKE